MYWRLPKLCLDGDIPVWILLLLFVVAIDIVAYRNLELFQWDDIRCGLRILQRRLTIFHGLLQCMTRDGCDLNVLYLSRFYEIRIVKMQVCLQPDCLESHISTFAAWDIPLTIIVVANSDFLPLEIFLCLLIDVRQTLNQRIVQVADSGDRFCVRGASSIKPHCLKRAILVCSTLIKWLEFEGCQDTLRRDL